MILKLDRFFVWSFYFFNLLNLQKSICKSYRPYKLTIKKFCYKDDITSLVLYSVLVTYFFHSQSKKKKKKKNIFRVTAFIWNFRECKLLTKADQRIPVLWRREGGLTAKWHEGNLGDDGHFKILVVRWVHRCIHFSKLKSGNSLWDAVKKGHVGSEPLKRQKY